MIFLHSITDIQLRYARTFFGQWWITLSFAIFVLGVGFIWSMIFDMNISKYLPNFSLGVCYWIFVSSIINGSTNLFIKYKSYILDKPFPKDIYYLAFIINQIIVFLYNFSVVIIVLLLYVNFNFEWYSNLISFLTVILNLVWIYFLSKILAIIGARYKDLDNIVDSIIKLTFFITPVLWSIENYNIETQKIILMLNLFAPGISAFKNLFLNNLNLEVLYICLTSQFICLIIFYSIFQYFIKKFESKIENWII